MEEEILSKIKYNSELLAEKEYNIKEINAYNNGLEERRDILLEEVDKENIREKILGDIVVLSIILSTALSIGKNINYVNMENITELDTIIRIFEVPMITAISTISLYGIDLKAHMHNIRKKYNFTGNINEEISDIIKMIKNNEEKKEELIKNILYDKAKLEILYELQDSCNNRLEEEQELSEINYESMLREKELTRIRVS